jgi:hypothetical protein
MTTTRGDNVRRTGTVGLIAAIGVLSGVGGASALASPPSVTLAGFATQTHGTPTSNLIDASIHATLSDGIATGTLATGGKVGDSLSGTWYNFKGDVTCMVMHGKRVTVGAFGEASVFHKSGGPEESLPGHYRQVFTVEWGEFVNTEFEERPVFPDTYGLLGKHQQGVRSNVPPSCNAASFAHQRVPTPGSWMEISPSITSPKDGYVSLGSVTLSGTAEPKGAITVYEVGHEASGTEITANAKGKWSLTLEGLSLGTHVFSAEAVKERIEPELPPANTVEVKVVG